MAKKKLGFIYVDKPFAVYHSIGIAIEVAKDTSIEVEILCSKLNYPLVKKLTTLFNNSNINVVLVRPHWYITLPSFFEKAFQILQKSIFYKYKKRFKSYDALVCAMYGDLVFKNLLGEESTCKFIYTEHGVPNWVYAFGERTKIFDLYFISGKEQLSIRRRLNHLTNSNHALTGYFKFEAVFKLPLKSTFENKKETVLYNPHWRKGLSSFPHFGLEILDYFSKNPNYNLIFAPHVNLLEKNRHYWLKIRKYQNYKNILIDSGSDKSYDMTYTRCADIYMGDASSQVYEFLYEQPKPCIFLDAHNLNKNIEERPLSWDLGEVVGNTVNFDLDTIIKDIVFKHKETYLPKQKEIIAGMFYQGEEKPSVIAAKAIDKLLSENE